jgi:hypothetical protein
MQVNPAAPAVQGAEPGDPPGASPGGEPVPELLAVGGDRARSTRRRFAGRRLPLRGPLVPALAVVVLWLVALLRCAP